ncbi:efflux transporter outer membrane subunit [Candidatus Methylospira mobilis]|uniref:Efflux transporter outer membrane subunit n=1 Tax=Candidatus Methylospira mobilis TaxID=1808979 RepID=A0A5Q0BIS7_9GAMM|nr:efflux transporter outer membrane subunit [Candidatus Methylospira mobilis]QFY43469.1 efflux transporter outer membrane subunit [Candidatus Methylospira mobilis]WNV03989.1 efflux transporter outer membrane subunit [Candidatus Methylospira mobilis]
MLPGILPIKVRLSWLAALLLLLNACVNPVGPDYQRPEIDKPASLPHHPEQTETKSMADLPWWGVFRDKTLQQLIKSAVANNYDLRATVQRIEQSDALARQAQSQLFPQIGYQVGLSNGKNSYFGMAAPFLRGESVSPIVTALNMSWELDIWGRIRRSTEAGYADMLASQEFRRGIMLSLVSSVAQAYFELLQLELRLAIAKKTTQSFDGSLQIFTQRLQFGVASKLETDRALSAKAQVAAHIPDLERQILVKENQINLLLGRNSGTIKRDIGLLQQELPVQIPAGLPSALLERRPDLRQAEQQLIAANARIGVARSLFFPKLGLTAILGRTSLELSGFTAGTSNLYGAFLSLAGPIFQGGMLMAQHDQAIAAYAQAELEYKQAALNAFKEVDNALINSEKLSEIKKQQTIATEALEDAVTVALERYVAGKASYYEVLEAQQQLYPTQVALTETELMQRTVIIQLYKALGGGWKFSDQEWLEAEAGKNVETTTDEGKMHE